MHNIHPTAIIESGAILGENVTIGAYAYIGHNVKLGDNCTVMHHATIDGNTTLGTYNIVHPYAYLGGNTQDLKYQGGEPGLLIGNNNVFREYFTAHVATSPDNSTIIGSNNTLLAYAHIAHDCIVGNNIIMSSSSALGGHTKVDDFANIAWSAGIHQFGRVGKYAMIGGQSKAVQDIPPYCIAEGQPANVRTVNIVNLQRKEFSEEEINQIKHMFKVIYKSGLNRSQAVEALSKDNAVAEEYKNEMINFIKTSTRGIC